MFEILNEAEKVALALLWPFIGMAVLIGAAMLHCKVTTGMFFPVHLDTDDSETDSI